MKRLFLLLLLSLPAFGQNVRWDLGAPGSAGAITTSGSGLQTLVAVPNVSLNWCAYPANALPCTNFAPTFTGISSSTQCPSNAQIVLQGSSSCAPTSDASGNLGVYTPAGTYSYTLTANGVSYGPFTVTVGGSGGGGGSGTVNSSSTACNAYYAATGTVLSGDCQITDDGLGNLGARSLTTNGVGQSAWQLADNASIAPTAGLMTIASLNGEPNLWEGLTGLGHIETSSEEGTAGGLATLDNSVLVPIAELASNPASCNAGTVLFGDRHCAAAGVGGGGSTWPLAFSSGANVSNSATNYLGIGTLGSSASNGAGTQWAVPRAGTVGPGFYCRSQQAMSGTMQYVLTMRKGLAATGLITSSTQAITCTISGGGTTASCNDTTHSFTVAAGDVIDVQDVPTNTPTASNLNCSVIFQ